MALGLIGLVALYWTWPRADQAVQLGPRTAIDYAFGVLLFFLLTGQHPAGPGPHSPAELMKAVVDTDTQQILGCTMLCAEGGEIMTIIQVAMMGKLPYTALKEGIFTHPTLAEGLNTLFTTLDS